MASATDAWANFFQSCDLPSNVCKVYAQRFVKERMQPYMLKDIGKEELRELGISAIGDQLAILRYMKLAGGNPQEFRDIGRTRASSGEEDEPMETQTKGKFAAPDRDEIYHVRMPAGNTPKTRNILEKQSVLREKGVIKRGLTGVRVSGIEVARTQTSLSKISNASKVIRKVQKGVMIQDISSSSPILNSGSMRSDAISTKTIVVATTPARNQARIVATNSSATVLNNNKILSRTQRIVATSQSSPKFHVRLNLDPATLEQPMSAPLNRNPRIIRQPNVPRKTVITQRIQRVSVPIANRLSNPRVLAVPANMVHQRSTQRAPVIQKRGSILNRISLNR